MIKVVIDGIETRKVSPYEHPLIIAERAKIHTEINKSVILPRLPKDPTPYQEKVELKAHKSSYKKLDAASKTSFLRIILERAIKDMPNWNFKVSEN